MSKTIQLISTTDNQRLNVILSGSTLSIDGKRYALTHHDLTRLLMFCEDNAERINQRVYTGESETNITDAMEAAINSGYFRQNK